MSKKSIILLIPYFGKWPNWFPFFLESCDYNPDIDWLFYTDCPVPDAPPDNVRFNTMSFEKYKALVSTKLGIAFNPESPYKLCDLKPFLGYLHSNDIQGYDFFGFSDIDLVYGDLRGYFDEEKLSRYELISTHKRRISGHFCLMRNNEKMRTACMHIPGWQEKLAAQKHFALDEKDFSKIFIQHKNHPTPIFKLLKWLNSWSRNTEFIEAYTTPNAKLARKHGSHNFPESWYWTNGVISNNLYPEHSYPYFHFFKWKVLWKGKTFYLKATNKKNTFRLWKLTKDGIDDISKP